MRTKRSRALPGAKCNASGCKKEKLRNGRTAISELLAMTRTGIELNFADFLTCREMGNSPYLRRFLALTCFIILSFIVSF